MSAALDEEYEALQASLTAHVTQGGRLAVVKAPPGSGKTHTLIETLAATVQEGERVAVAAQTNSQADDIVRRMAKAHPSVRTVRFASASHLAAVDMPASVQWISKKDELPAGAGITVATTAKWALTQLGRPYDLLAIDEAWQMSWADLMQCALIGPRFLMIGDPGQIPPVVTIDVRRWETSPRAPHEAAPNIVLRDPSLAGERFEGSLPACRRLPHEAVGYIRAFYDFDFAAYVGPAERGVDLPSGHAYTALSDGFPLALTLPTPIDGPPLEVDHGLAQAAAVLVGDLLGGSATVRDGHGPPRPLVGADIGLTSSHRVMNAAISAALWGAGDVAGVRVDTPERWQGLERALMIAVHPLSGVTAPSAFDLETGRLCVMASRHQAALIVLTRDHIGETLANHVPSAEQAPGRPDVVGRGHDAHSRFWQQLVDGGRIFAIS